MSESGRALGVPISTSLAAGDGPWGVTAKNTIRVEYPMGNPILVPHDGSEQADAALRFAFETFPDASVVVLHVVEPFPDHIDAGVENGAGSGTGPTNSRTRFSTTFEPSQRKSIDPSIRSGSTVDRNT